MCIVIFLLIEGLEIEHVHLYLLGEQGLVLSGFDGAMNKCKDIVMKRLIQNINMEIANFGNK
jgi:hypothetical protein